MSDPEVIIKVGAVDDASDTFEHIKDNAQDSADGIAAAYKTLGIRSFKSIDESRQKIIAAYEAIKNSGTATAVEIQRAYEAAQAATEKLDFEAGIISEAKQVENAFANLGVKSAADIEAAKKRIIAAYETIKNSGTASAAEIKRAYEAAQAATEKLDFEAGIVSEAQQVQNAFATLGVKSSADIEAAKKRIIAAYEAIKNSGTASAEDVKNAYNESQRQLKSLSAPDKTEQAFSLLGVTKQADVNAQKAAIIQAYQQIKSSGTASAEDVRKAWEASRRELDRLDGKLDDTNANFKNTTTSLGSQVKGLALQFVGIGAAMSLAGDAFNRIMTNTQLETRIKRVVGEGEAFAETNQYLSETANRLNADLLGLKESYAG
jgi:predicted house-cleaning noncanonical NTP pyrophosphatase (MazG superfamily)